MKVSSHMFIFVANFVHLVIKNIIKPLPHIKMYRREDLVQEGYTKSKVKVGVFNPVLQPGSFGTALSVLGVEPTQK